MTRQATYVLFLSVSIINTIFLDVGQLLIRVTGAAGRGNADSLSIIRSSDSVPLH